MSATADWRDVLDGSAQWCVVWGDNADVLPRLPEKSVAHVITDPPYEAEAHTKARRCPKPGEAANDYVIPFAAMTEEGRADTSREVCRVSGRWVLVFCQVEGVHLWRRALETAAAKWRRCAVWVKPDSAYTFRRLQGQQVTPA